MTDNPESGDVSAARAVTPHEVVAAVGGILAVLTNPTRTGLLDRVAGVLERLERRVQMLELERVHERSSPPDE